MIQLIVFLIVLAVVFALKTVAVLKTQDDIIANSEAFSWMHAREQDAETAAQWATEEDTELAVQPRVSMGTMRRVGGANA